MKADATKAAPAASVAMLTEKHGTVSAPPETTRYHFNPQDAERDLPVEHIFTLENKTKSPLVITLLDPACGCISAEFVQTPTPTLPFTLRPDARVSLRVTLNLEAALAGLAAKPIEKDVKVFIRGQNAPVATLQISGYLGD